MELKEGVIFEFGRHSGKSIEFLIQTESNYIDWIIGNFEYLEIHPFFLQKAIRLNPDFEISKIYLEKFKIGVSNFLQEYTGNDYSELNTYFKSNKYLKVPLLTEVEKKASRLKIKSLRLQLLEEAKIKRKNETFKLNKLKNKSDSQKMIDDFWNDIENHKFSSSSQDDDINWKKYDENLGWGEQSEDFWNQF